MEIYTVSLFLTKRAFCVKENVKIALMTPGFDYAIDITPFIKTTRR